MYGHTRRDMIKNKDIQDNVEVASEVEKMREARQRWLGHVRGDVHDPR